MCFVSRLFILTLLGLPCLGLTACTSFPPKIYRMDIRQGNIITPEMICQLKVGMSKSEVQDILGSSAISHALHRDRWDYYYYLKPGNGDPIIEKHFTVFFKGDRLSHWREGCPE